MNKTIVWTAAPQAADYDHIATPTGRTYEGKMRVYREVVLEGAESSIMHQRGRYQSFLGGTFDAEQFENLKSAL